jgi:hypothetical protein
MKGLLMPLHSNKKNEGHYTTITTPSRFGSHSSMIVRELENGRVVCVDEFGEYETDRSRIDSGAADVNRWARKV